jgi:HEPN domain-containing protein
MNELINPPTLDDLNHDELVAWIEDLRIRRSRIQLVVRKTKQAVGKSLDTTLIAVLAKRVKRLTVIEGRLNKNMALAEGLVNEIIAIRLELQDISPEELNKEMRDEDVSRVSEDQGEG